MKAIGKAPADIAILMATYNGERYISEQIDSILAQTFDSWNLIIRDDGSTDKTAAIVMNYVSAHPEKIRFIDDGGTNLGPCQNFSRLLEVADAPYLMFSDQDDVWMPGKIEKTFLAMKALEEKFTAGTPLLVHTDLKITDKDLNIISHSFRKYQKIRPQKAKYLRRLLLENSVTGSTIMINNSLRDLVMPIPREAPVHDWWIALVASALGKIEYIPESCVMYRQHGKNELGAKRWDFYHIVGGILKKRSKFRKGLIEAQRQGGALLERFSARLSGEDRKMVAIFSSLGSYNYFQRRYYFLRYGFLKMGFIRNLGLFVKG